MGKGMGGKGTAVHIFIGAEGRYFTSTTRKRVGLDFTCQSTADPLACASCLYFQPLAGGKDVHSSGLVPIPRLFQQAPEAKPRTPSDVFYRNVASMTSFWIPDWPMANA